MSPKKMRRSQSLLPARLITVLAPGTTGSCTSFSTIGSLNPPNTFHSCLWE